MKKIKHAEDKQNNTERESQKNLLQETYYETQTRVQQTVYMAMSDSNKKPEICLGIMAS